MYNERKRERERRGAERSNTQIWTMNKYKGRVVNCISEAA
jgi:hypothetical protein